MKVSRRTLLLTGGAGLLLAAAASGQGRNLFYAALTEDSDSTVLTAPEALKRVEEGTLTLVDIRRPDEWADTGSPKGAVQLDMRREDFTDALKEIVGGDTSAPVAVICMRGVRSARLANRMLEAGFTSVHDVPEGMLGSRAGPGWLKRGLPLSKG